MFRLCFGNYAAKITFFVETSKCGGIKNDWHKPEKPACANYYDSGYPENPESPESPESPENPEKALTLRYKW
jgi:hypothetical protein